MYCSLWVHKWPCQQWLGSYTDCQQRVYIREFYTWRVMWKELFQTMSSDATDCWKLWKSETGRAGSVPVCSLQRDFSGSVGSTVGEGPHRSDINAIPNTLFNWLCCVTCLPKPPPHSHTGRHTDECKPTNTHTHTHTCAQGSNQNIKLWNRDGVGWGGWGGCMCLRLKLLTLYAGSLK